MTSLNLKNDCKRILANRLSSRGMSRCGARSGFTLVELLMVISIIAILASLGVAVLRSAENDSRAARTETIVTKIDNVIQRRFEAYETRTLPFRIDTNMGFEDRRQLRNLVLAEWIRGEMPTSEMDLNNFGDSGAFSGTSREPAMVKRLRRHFAPSSGVDQNWAAQNQGAECLYAILKNSWDGDNRGTHFLTPQEIGDTDGDGALEVLDGWGDPMLFSVTANGSPVDPNNVDPANPVTLNDYVFEVISSRNL